VRGVRVRSHWRGGGDAQALTSSSTDPSLFVPPLKRSTLSSQAHV
jgi:hypothetical protein